VLEVNGLYRHGFMISPAMLDVVLELLRNGPPLARNSMSPCTCRNRRPNFGAQP
jgi:glycine/D-amino acid oxidase-like deaminating enzyme